MPIYNGNTKVSLSGIKAAYVGNTKVMSSGGWYTIFEGSKTFTAQESWNPGLVATSGSYKLRITFSCTSTISGASSSSLSYCEKQRPYEVLFNVSGSAASSVTTGSVVKEFEFTNGTFNLVSITSKKANTILAVLDFRWSSSVSFYVAVSSGTGGSSGCTPSITITKVEQYLDSPPTPPVPTSVPVILKNFDTLNTHSVTVAGTTYTVAKGGTQTLNVSFPFIINCSQAHTFVYDGSHGTVSDKSVSYVAQAMTEVQVQISMEGVNSRYRVVDF